MSRRRRLWILGIISLVIILTSIVVISYYHEGVEIQSWVLDHEKLKATEKRFQKKPTLDDCINILDKYSFLKKYKESIDIAEKCLAIGVEDYKFAWLIHLRMAISYKRLMDDDKAYRHALRALELDKNGTMKSGGWLQTLKLEGIEVNETSR